MSYNKGCSYSHRSSTKQSQYKQVDKFEKDCFAQCKISMTKLFINKNRHEISMAVAIYNDCFNPLLPVVQAYWFRGFLAMSPSIHRQRKSR